MKRAKIFFWLKIAGLLSAFIVLLTGTSSCRSRKHQTKYGPPPDYNQTITKYGIPSDLIDDTNDTNNTDGTLFKDTVNYPITKYGVPVEKPEFLPKE